jgi:hypothetical protein
MALPLFALGANVRGASAATRKVGVFRSDVTPEMGEPLIWIDPTIKVEDPLWAKGVVIEDRGSRFVLCAFDWCGLGSSIHLRIRTALAKAAGTSVDHVWVHSIHQHTAPYVDGDAYAIMRKLSNPPLMLSDGFLTRITDRLARAVDESTSQMKAFDSLGLGQARVERVASARRSLDENGKALTRYSTSGADPKFAAMPEGEIDPMIKTVTLSGAGKPLVRLHFYATHPQTLCCDGRVSGDIAGLAREDVERSDGAFQVYFTGCAGDITVGKYNDKSAEAQRGLTERLAQGMRASIASTTFEPAGRITFRVLDFRLNAKTAPRTQSVGELEELVMSGKLSGADLYRAALPLAYAQRKIPLQAALFEMGKLSLVHLPGEPMLEFQKYAQGLRPGRFVAVAGYSDISPGYLCTDRAMAEGGYEPGASNVGPGVEAGVKKVMRDLFEGGV